MLAARPTCAMSACARCGTWSHRSPATEQAATHGDPVVLIAADLAPSDTAALDIRRVAGLATTLGGPTSHTAIRAPWDCRRSSPRARSCWILSTARR